MQDVYSARRSAAHGGRPSTGRARSSASLEPARPRTVRRTCSDRMICHPSQLLERLATSEDIIRCYIRRDRTRGPFPHRRYDLCLWGGPLQGGKAPAGRAPPPAGHQVFLRDLPGRLGEGRLASHAAREARPAAVHPVRHRVLSFTRRRAWGRGRAASGGRRAGASSTPSTCWEVGAPGALG